MDDDDTDSYTLRQSDMHRSMLPRPATSTTFSCQLSSTLMPVPVTSFVPPGLEPIWLNPVTWGVRFRVGVRIPPLDEPPDMPLYLYKRLDMRSDKSVHT